MPHFKRLTQQLRVQPVRGSVQIYFLVSFILFIALLVEFATLTSYSLYSIAFLCVFLHFRFRRMKHPVYWCGMNAGITVACVWFLAWRYTRFLCERRTEFINAGRIFGAELHGRGWDPPPEINHLVSVRKSANGRKFTFLSAHGNYDFMVKSNYHVCASAMPQLRCECEEESGSGCAINPKFGTYSNMFVPYLRCSFSKFQWDLIFSTE